MTDAGSLKPHETLLEMRAMARQEWSRAGELEDGLAQLTTRISDEVTEALVGASSTQAGWAMFAFGMDLMVSAEAWAATVSASRGELGKGDVHRGAAGRAQHRRPPVPGRRLVDRAWGGGAGRRQGGRFQPRRAAPEGAPGRGRFSADLAPRAGAKGR